MAIGSGMAEYVDGVLGHIQGADLNNADPRAFDRSELTRWAAYQAGVEIPDGWPAQFETRIGTNPADDPMSDVSFDLH